MSMILLKLGASDINVLEMIGKGDARFMHLASFTTEGRSEAEEPRPTSVLLTGSRVFLGVSFPCRRRQSPACPALFPPQVRVGHAESLQGAPPPAVPACRALTSQQVEGCEVFAQPSRQCSTLQPRSCYLLLNSPHTDPLWLLWAWAWDPRSPSPRMGCFFPVSRFLRKASRCSYPRWTAPVLCFPLQLMPPRKFLDKLSVAHIPPYSRHCNLLKLKYPFMR